VLAEEQGTRFFVDDWKARDVATRFGIKVFGSLGVLAEAKRRGLIAEVRPIIEELLAIGYWMHGERVVRPFLREIGEAPE
jgi:predicted nucleic acid-binding protein